MASSDLFVTQPGTSGGLTLQRLEDMLSDIRNQPVWRPDADRDVDYYDSHQLDGEKLSRMERLGIPPLITNLIKPTIDAVLGMEAKTRTDWRVTQEDEAQDAPESVMDALNIKLKEAERESRADRAISDAYSGQVKAGLGWVEVSRQRDVMRYPYRVGFVHRSEVWWDWRAKEPDLSDSRYLIRKKRFDCDELAMLMPEHAKLIYTAVRDGFRTWQWDTEETYDNNLVMAADVERVTNIDSSDWRDAERKRATLFEVWYRVWVNDLVIRLPNRKVIPFDKKDVRHIAAQAAGVVSPFKATYTKIRCAIYLGPHRLYDFPTPYRHNHFPYVPFWGFREDRSAIPYGLIRPMISPQDVVNAADARMHWMLNAKRIEADSDALDLRRNSWRQVQDEINRPDGVVLFDPAKRDARFKVVSDMQLSQQQFERRMQAAADVENAGGIYKAMLGKDTVGASSGIAINSLVEQGNIMLAEINDNYSFARRQVGELLFSMVREDLVGCECNVAVKKGRNKVVVGLNKRVGDEVENDVSKVPVKVVLEDVPSTPAFRAQQLQILSEVVKSLPPEMQAVTAHFLVGLTDAPHREEIVEQMKKVAGIQEDTSPEEEAAAANAQAQAEAQARATEAEMASAQIEKTLADAELSRAKAEEVAQRTELTDIAVSSGARNAPMPMAGESISGRNSLAEPMEPSGQEQK